MAGCVGVGTSMVVGAGVSVDSITQTFSSSMPWAAFGVFAVGVRGSEKCLLRIPVGSVPGIERLNRFFGRSMQGD